jgi:hypothetical protein
MRQIIITQNTLSQGSMMNINYVYWLSVPAGLVRPNASGTTVVPNAGTAEIAAIQAGSVQELDLSATVPLSWGVATIGSYLVERYNTEQSYLNSVGTLKNYGTALTSYDGTTWGNLPV